MLFDGPAKRNLHLALVDLPVSLFDLGAVGISVDAGQATITCLRSTLMKPEHNEWLDRIWTILKNEAAHD